MKGQRELARPDSSEIFKENLKRLRRHFGLTQQQLGDVLNIPRSTIGALEEGRCRPSVDLLLELERLYDVTVQEMCCTQLNSTDREKRERLWTLKQITKAVTSVVGDGAAWGLIKSKLL